MMSKTNIRSHYRSVFNLTAHLVFVTKYRLRVIDAAMLEELEEVFRSVLSKWDSSMLEFDGEADHVHLLIDYPPHKLPSSLISNLKSTASKTMWNRHENRLKRFYWKEGKRVFWTGAYFIASCGGVTIEQLKEYVRNQDSPKV